MKSDAKRNAHETNTPPSTETSSGIQLLPSLLNLYDELNRNGIVVNQRGNYIDIYVKVPQNSSLVFGIVRTSDPELQLEIFLK